jgi:NHL repeat/6-bladed beta-propeller
LVPVPNSIAIDSSDNLYVLDTANNRVQKFNSALVFQSKFGSFGTADGQFKTPRGMALDSTGDNIFVADTENNRIQKFNVVDGFVSKFGINGAADGQLSSPYGVKVDATGNIFVLDSGNYRVQKFNSSGVFQAKYGSQGTGAGQFGTTDGFNLSNSGNIYVADAGNSRVVEFTASSNRIVDLRPESAAVEFSSSNALGSDEGPDGNTNMPKLLINGALAATRKVKITVTGGTATKGTDYNYTDYDINIAAGVYDGTINSALTLTAPNLLQDTLVEGNETIEFTLSTTADSTNVSLGDADGNAKTYSTTKYSIKDDEYVRVDKNGDGTLDFQQPEVSTFLDSNGKEVTIAGPAGSSVVETTGIAATSLETKDGTNNYILGLNAFEIDGVTPGASVLVRMTLDKEYDTTGWQLRHYNRVTKVYSTVAGVTFDKVTISGVSKTRISYTIVDGGPLDEDGTANGVIKDPVGVVDTKSPAATVADTKSLAATGSNLFVYLGAFMAIIAGLLSAGYFTLKNQKAKLNK